MIVETERIRSHAWHLVQISETSTPGLYNAFAVSDGAMRRFELIVPRIFYVDDTFERPTSNGRKVEKTLPRMRPHSHLYEYSADEKKFVDKLSAFNEQLCKNNINGIYETQVPLDFQAILKIGATSNVKSLVSATRIKADQMERIPGSKLPYIEMSAFQVVYFYELSVNNRTAFALFNPAKSHAHICIVNRADVDLPNVNNVFKKEYAKYVEKYGLGRLLEGTDKMSVQISQAKFSKDGVRLFQNLIKGYKWSQVDPVLFCVQSTKSDSVLRKEFPSLSQYPIVRIAATDSTSMLSGLEWWSKISKRIVVHFLNSYAILSDMWAIADYVGIPLGNLPEGDSASRSLDILYARSLQKQNFILWASPSDKPDFGGKEFDDWQLGMDWENVSFNSCLSHVYDVEMFESRYYCVEFNLGVLAVTALMNSALIAEAEGTSENVGFASECPHMTIEERLNGVRKDRMTEFNESVSISGALRVLRSICARLIRDIKPGESDFADQLIISLYRWVRSPASLLYDPAVEQAVFTMMRKLCLLLVTELNHLGARVAHCSFSKVVLCTKRSDLQSARGFVDTLRASLRRKKLFASLNLIPTRYSRAMIWIDASNKAYVRSFDPLAEIIMENNNKAQVEMQLANVLLETGDCRRVFNNIVIFYLSSLSKKAREELPEEEFVAFACDKFRDDVAPRIFGIVNTLIENQAQVRQAMEAEKIPVLKSYNLTKHANVPLQFIKCCFKVFELYEPIQEVVAEIRYQALLLVGRDEFSSESIWQPPKVNVILEQIFCQHCLMNVDLDVCAQKHPETENDETFICPACTRTLSKFHIEQNLIDRAKKMQVAYQIQDIRCIKCKQTGNRLLTSNCQFCFNAYENTIPLEDYKTNLEVLADISDVYILENLAFVIKDILQTIQI